MKFIQRNGSAKTANKRDKEIIDAIEKININRVSIASYAVDLLYAKLKLIVYEANNKYPKVAPAELRMHTFDDVIHYYIMNAKNETIISFIVYEVKRDITEEI